MNPIKLTTASAGSGKTYYLTQMLESELSSGRVRPEGILAVTFTVKAAAELAARARRCLLGAHRVEDAQALATARIGTVHSVCSRLVGEFAFELGLPPEVEVLDAAGSGLAFREALTRVVETSPAAEGLDARAARFHATVKRGMSAAEAKLVAKQRLDWRGVVEELVADARSNDVQPAEFGLFAQRSIETLSALLAKPRLSAKKLDDALRKALRETLEGVDLQQDTTKVTRDALGMVHGLSASLDRGGALAWTDWLRLSKLKPGKKSQTAFDPLIEAAQAHDAHPLLHEDVRVLIEGVFEIAQQAYESYATYKRERGLVDFTDQESQAFALLKLPSVRDQLAGELELVLIDEFQDTSPLQLAIFLELSALAKRSVWVGDQKQSIYGFRGADPSLMDAVLEQVVDSAHSDVLSTSFRSRPDLVRVTSELFAQAFAPQGIPPERVRLTPDLKIEPEGLGPVLERWILESKNKESDTSAVAVHVEALLQDESVRVRDRYTGEPRALRASDVAVLCRTNDTCTNLAASIEARGLKVRWARQGLVRTPEVRLWLASLAVLADPFDSLHAAEVVRLLDRDPDSDAWLENLLNEGATGLRTHPVVARLCAVHTASPARAPLEALDLAAEVVALREVAVGWGDAARRLANLDLFRDHARAVADRLRVEGEAITSSVLRRHLNSLEGELDRQALPDVEDAVVVGTWHGAKGLEWPITILYELQLNERVDSFGAQVQSTADTLDLTQPLQGRWLRFWPYPYGGHSTDVPMLERLAELPETVEAHRAQARENLRLAYVGFTRARDRLVLADRDGGLDKAALTQLVSASGDRLLSEPKGNRVCWAGVELDIRVRTAEASEPEALAFVPGEITKARGYAPAPQYSVLPSDLEAVAPVKHVHDIGPRLPLRGKADMQRIGEAVHGFLAADRPTFDADSRTELATRLLAHWGVSAHLDPSDMILSSERLRKWLTTHHPEALWHREWPMQRANSAGTLVRGVADLLLEDPLGWTVIDHKSFPGTRDQAVERAAGFGGQLHAYAWILGGQTPRPAVTSYVHLPLLGMLVELDVDPEQEPAWPAPSRRLSAFPEAV